MIMAAGSFRLLGSTNKLMSHAGSKKTQRITALLHDGMTAARTGQRAEARRLFEAVLRLDPRNEEAILWWAGLARDPQAALTALARVLDINPQNRRARAGIRDIRRRLAGETALPVSIGIQHGGQQPADPLPAVASSTVRRFQRHEQERSAQPKPVASERLNAFVVGLALLVVALACVLATVVLPDAPQAVWAAFKPSATPTTTATATSTFTATPTPLPTDTATLAPTSTPTQPPSPTPTPAPTLAFPVPPISSAPTEDKWIDIDLSEQHLVAYVGTVPVYAVKVSTGLARTPTIKGQFRIYRKLTATAMAGPGYYLPGVPWTMYYHKSYAIHGTYWHDNFGQPMSHGCVNLPTPDAKWLFDWTPDETLVVVHD